MNEPKKEAERIFNEHYVSIFEYGEELSEEIIISLLAQKAALITVKEKYKSLREQLFNLKSCRVIKSEKTYLHRLDELISEEKQVKEELENI